MKSQGSLWPYLWACAQDVSTLVTSDFERKDKEGLRGASRAGRTAVNATVSKLEISEEKDLRDLPQLRLHERFPRLASVALKGKRKSFSATTFNLFASETLSKLSKLTSLDLSHCNDLDAAPTCAALVRCPQLQELTLPEGEQASVTVIHLTDEIFQRRPRSTHCCFAPFYIVTCMPFKMIIVAAALQICVVVQAPI
jgi:hypothetical protein